MIQEQNFVFCKKLNDKSNQFNALIAVAITVEQSNQVRLVKRPELNNKDVILLLKDCLNKLENQEQNKIITLGE